MARLFPHWHANLGDWRALGRWRAKLGDWHAFGAWARIARMARDLASSFFASIKEFLILAGRPGTGLSFYGV